MSIQSDRIREALQRSKPPQASNDVPLPEHAEERKQPAIAVNLEALEALFGPDTPASPAAEPASTIEVIEEVAAPSEVAAESREEVAAPREAEPAPTEVETALPVLAASDQDRIEWRQFVAAAPPSQPANIERVDDAETMLPPLAANPADSPSRLNRTYLALGAAALALTVAAIATFWSLAPRKQSAPAPVASFPLQLQVAPQGNGLDIRWNPGSTPVAQAREGRLVILERDQQPQIVDLRPDQLRTGHLYYQSAAERLEFRLEVVSGAGVVSM
jgi:hypothetical protein